MCQQAELAIAKQPCDFGNRQQFIMKIALGEGGPQLVQYLREGSTSSPSLRDKVRKLIPSRRATSDAVALPCGSSFGRMSSAFVRTVRRSRELRASASSA